MEKHEAPMKEQGERKTGSFLASRAGLALLGFIAIAGYFLWSEHEAHAKAVVPYLPWLLVLACPLLHLFMHGKHGGHGDEGRHEHGGKASTRESDR
jgi:hypothetical protein